MLNSKLLKVYGQYSLPRFIGTPSQVPVFTRDVYNSLIQRKGVHVFITHNPVIIARNGSYRITEVMNMKYFIDLDGEWHDVRRDTERIVDFLNENNMQYTLMFSGMKGIHINIFFRPVWVKYGEENTMKRRAVNRYLKYALNLKTIDTSVFELVRLQRVVNTQHPVSKLYAIPFRYEEIDDVKEIAACERVVGDARQFRTRGKLITFDEFAESVEWGRFVEVDNNECLEFRLPDGDVERYIDMLIPMKCVVNLIFTPNPPHYIRFAFGAWLRFLNFGYDDAYRLMEYVGKKYWSDWSERVTRYQLRNIYMNGYKPPKCSSMRAYGVCVGKVCPWYDE